MVQINWQISIPNIIFQAIIKKWEIHIFKKILMKFAYIPSSIRQSIAQVDVSELLCLLGSVCILHNLLYVQLYEAHIVRITTVTLLSTGIKWSMYRTVLTHIKRESKWQTNRHQRQFEPSKQNKNTVDWFIKLYSRDELPYVCTYIPKLFWQCFDDSSARIHDKRMTTHKN